MNDALEVTKSFAEGVVRHYVKFCWPGLLWSVAGAPSLVQWGVGLTEGVVTGKIQISFFGAEWGPDLA